MQYTAPFSPPVVEKTIHQLVNESVANLGVICVGFKDGCLYFERRSAAGDLDALAQEIIKRLMAADNARVRESLRSSITSISIS